MTKGLISHTPGRHPNPADIRNSPVLYDVLARDARYWSKHPDVGEAWQHVFKELAQRFRQKAAYRRTLPFNIGVEFPTDKIK